MLFPYILSGVFLAGQLVTGCTYLDDYHYFCSVWTYNDCWCYMDNHVDNLEEAIVPSYTEDELTPLCNAYAQVEVCLTQFIDDCHPTIQNNFNSANDSWHYICVETKQEFISEHRDCLDNEELHQEGEVVCYDHLVEQLDRLRESEFDIETIFERQCHLVNNYLDCVENLIRSYDTCSESTALWQRELDRRWIDPLLTGTNCQLDNSTGKNVYIYRTVIVSQSTESPGRHSPVPTGVLIGCTIVLGIIIVAVGLLIVFKCMSNKKHQQQQQNAWAASQTANQGATQGNNQAQNRPQLYGYGGGAVAFGVFEDPLPGKDGEKGEADHPPEYKEMGDEETGYAPPSQPPPYTGFPRAVSNPLYHANNTTTTSTDCTMTDVEH